MIIERFINAALYFDANTEKLDTIKLYKLLFLSDRACIKKTGHTITECTYRKISPWGPVPKEAKAIVDGMASGDKGNPIIARVLKVEKHRKNTHIEFSGTADLKYFTDDEKKILEKLAKKYKYWGGKKIAHGVHEMRSIKNMEWEKDFNLEITLDKQDENALKEDRKIADKFRLAIEHA